MNTLIHGNGPRVYLPTFMMPEVAKINNFLQSFKNPRAIFYFVNRIFFYILFLLLNLATSGIMDVGSIGKSYL